MLFDSYCFNYFVDYNDFFRDLNTFEKNSKSFLSNANPFVAILRKSANFIGLSPSNHIKYDII